MRKNIVEHPDRRYMERAIKVAKSAAPKGQYPLGAVVVRDGKILSVAHTTLQGTNDPTAHAEINAIRIAAQKVGSRFLERAWLYSTQEPCPMCASTAIWAKMAGIVYGATTADALKIYRKQRNKKFSWRQINITAEEVIAKGEPKLALYKKFLRNECLKLFKLAK